MRKKISTIVLVLLCAGTILSLAACGGTGKQPETTVDAASSATPTQQTSPVSQTPEAQTTEASEPESETEQPEPAVEPTEPSEPQGSKILVAVFSATGNTAPLAETVSELLGADLDVITPAQPYTEADLAYYTGGRCDQEQADPDCRPAIEGQAADMARYDTVVIAHPIWHGQIGRAHV